MIAKDERDKNLMMFFNKAVSLTFFKPFHVPTIFLGLRLK